MIKRTFITHHIIKAYYGISESIKLPLLNEDMTYESPLLTVIKIAKSEGPFSL